MECSEKMAVGAGIVMWNSCECWSDSQRHT